MLITPANPCNGIAGLYISRQKVQMTKIPSLKNWNNYPNTLFTIPPVVVRRAWKSFRCGARRRVRDDGGSEDEDESYGYNEEIAKLEIYTQTCREEALIVTAIVEDEEVEVIIFKGMSSCLSGETVVDPAKSVLPERAVIKKIDRVRGPFDPSQIDYIQKGISFQEFKETRLN